MIGTKLHAGIFAVTMGLLTAQESVAQQQVWQFATDAQQVIGSVDLLGPDGAPLVALRCLAAQTPVEARLAHPSAVGRVAPERTAALLIAPSLMPSPQSPSLAVFRLPDGRAEQVLVRFERTDGLPMGPVASTSGVFAALAAGQDVTLTPAGAAPVSLAGDGLHEGMAQLIRHCGLPVAPSGPAAVGQGLALLAAPVTPALNPMAVTPAPAPAAVPVPAASGAWRFVADSQPMIGSAELIGADGRLIVALRCVKAKASHDVLRALPTAVGSVAVQSRGVAFILAPELLPDPLAANKVLLQAAVGKPLEVRMQFMQPDNLPMGPLSVMAGAFSAMASGVDVAVEPTDILSIPLRAPGMQESVNSLIQYCDLQRPRLMEAPVTASAAPPVAPGGAPAAVDMTQFDADLLLWTLGQWRNQPGFTAQSHDMVNLSVLERTFRTMPVPEGYPLYPGRRNVPGEQVKAWGEGMVDTAAQRATTPPEHFTLETQVRIETAADGRLFAFPASAGTSVIAVDYNSRNRDPVFTVRELRHSFADNFNLELVVDQPLPLEVPVHAAPVSIGAEKAMAMVRVHGQLSGYRTGSNYRSLMATMSIERAELFEAVKDGRQLTAGRLLHVWDDSTRAVEAPTPSIAAEATAADIRAIYGTSELDGRVMTWLGPYEIKTHRPDLAPPDTGVLSRNGYVADTEAALATRLAAVIRAAPERPLSTEVALTIAQSLMTAQQRDTLFPPLTFHRNTPTLERDAALRAGDGVLKEAVLRLALPSPLAMTELSTAQAQPFNAHFGILQVNTGLAERVWIGQLDRPIQISEGLPMTEAQAVELLRYQTASGHPNVLVRRFDWSLVAAEGPPGRTGPIEQREVDLIALRVVSERFRLFADFAMTVTLFDQSFDAPTIGEPVPRDLFLTTWESLVAGKVALFPDKADLPLFGETLFAPPEIMALPEPLRGQAIAAEEQRVRALARKDYYMLWRFSAPEYDTARGGFKVSDKKASLAIPHDQDLSMDSRRRESSYGKPAIEMNEAVAFDFLPIPPEHREMFQGFSGNWNDYQVVLRGHLVPAMTPDREDPRPARFVPEEILVGPGSRRTGIDSVVLRLPWPATGQAAPTTASAEVSAPETLILDAEAVDLLVLKHAPALYDDRALERMLIERLARERAVLRERLREGETRRVLPWGQFFSDPEAGLTPQARTALLPAFRAWSEARAAVLPDRVSVIRPGQSGKAASTHDCSTTFPMQEPRGHVGEAMVDEVLGAGTWQGFLDTVARRRAYDRSVRDYPVAHFLPAGITRRVSGVASRCELAANLIDKDRPGPTAFATGFDTVDAPQADLILIGDQGLEMRGGGIATIMELTDLQLAVQPVGPHGTPVVATIIMGGRTERVVALHPPASPAQPPVSEVIWSPEVREAQRGVAPKAHDILGLTLGIDRGAFREEAVAILGTNAVEVTVAAEPNKRHLGLASGFVDPDTHEGLIAIFANSAPDGPVIALARRIVLPRDTDHATVMAALVEKYVAQGSAPEIRDGRFLFVGVPIAELDRQGVCGRQITQGRMSGTETLAEGTDPERAGRYPRGYFYNIGGVDDAALEALVTPGSPNMPEVACGPAVVAAIQPFSTRDGSVDALTIWLIDMSAAAAAIQSTREMTSEPARIRL